MDNIKNSIEPKKVRPSQLSFLCILSFIGGGASILSNLFIYSLFDQIKIYFESGATQKILGTEIDMGFLLDINPDFFLFQMALFAFSVYGVYLMWNLKMTGFHIYSVSQILLFILPEIYVPSLPFPFLEIALTVVFVLLYYKNLKEIGKE
jgi:hypothetical protein